MELIIEKGYYLSDASHFVDYHAGLKFEKMNYSALWFLDDITVMSNGKADDVIFSKEDFMISNIKATYELNDEELTVYFNKGGEYNWLPNMAQDRVSGFTIKQVQDIIKGSQSWGEVKGKLRSQYPNTANLTDELLTNWQ